MTPESEGVVLIIKAMSRLGVRTIDEWFQETPLFARIDAYALEAILGPYLDKLREKIER